MNIKNKQLNRKNLIGLALCTVLVVILASFVLSFFAAASTPDTAKISSTPAPNQRATATVRVAGATPTVSKKSRIAQASPNPAITPTTPAAAPAQARLHQCCWGPISV
ncbi:hypothetical protein [Reticulibacter mediterranei]|uniref:hypothetical protein n=1 Tax=Reticulibacter mediterranei TaxID=2778369 RepID=UPI001C68DDF7|nr:hypothetical protein [Reticulibacter mediterranei]